MKLRGIALFVVALIAGSTCLNAESYPDAVILQETGFPSSDSSVPSASMLSAVLPGAQTVSAAELPAAISKADCTLMVLPYGSAFPEDSWPQILAYLNRGGNLLVLGGRPFTRAAYRDSSGWHLRDYSVRFIRELGIDNYTTVPGSEGLQFQLNSELVARLQPFAWSHAFSPIVHLSYEQTNDGIGAAGYLSARLDAFAWSVRDESQISAPAIQIDHLRERFQGGRWVFLNAELPSSFFESDRATQVLSTLAGSARRGAATVPAGRERSAGSELARQGGDRRQADGRDQSCVRNRSVASIHHEYRSPERWHCDAVRGKDQGISCD
jgi:hypothetical protein